ncbi:MAG: hypothetical protein ACM3US_15730 [Sphingomonadaceae bacterium]
MNGHSGIEVADADTLYAANAAGGSLFCVTKDGSIQGRLADPTLTLEDIEVDDVTFAPRRVVWVRDTIDRNRLRAVEIVPAPCVQGATPGPTSVPAPPAVAGATPQPAPAPGGALDAKVEIVFPHDAAGNPIPVENLTQAPLVNIEVAIFAAGTLQSAPPDANLTVRLFSSLNNDPQREIAVGQRVIGDIGGLQQPRWVFNDVDVSQAQDPLNKYYFRVSVDGIATNSNVWSHGADARTIFPQVDTPSRSCQ